jgi:Tfp pilus assembly protein FimT
MSRGHSTPLHSPRFAAGFSGIELLVCLALLAGLTTMAMPVGRTGANATTPKLHAT